MAKKTPSSCLAYLLCVVAILSFLAHNVSGISDGAAIVLNPCDPSSPLQQWDVSSLSTDGTVRLKSNNSQCLDIYAFNTANGSWTDLWTCHTSDKNPSQQNQEWTWNLQGVMQSKLGINLCLDDLHFASSPGSTVGIWACNGGQNQQWVYNAADNTIRGVFTGLCLSVQVFANNITANGKNYGRALDGIGGLSGGGATSVFLPSYPEPYQSQILDFLFKPNFGASLQILKVEIGGDTQSTEGTEASHMHLRDDENYFRGYEWWLMEEAKKRNPDILIYGLSWGVPGWIGDGNFFSQDNIDYHVKWINGAQKYHNVTVDFVGIWNERGYTTDFIENFRTGLDEAGLESVKIVAHDQGFDIVTDIQNNKSFSDSIDFVGVHYPGTSSPLSAQQLPQKLWASEDDATDNGQTFARIINQNYVNGYFTATIHWNLITAYYNGLQFSSSGLMAAQSPWTGNYEVQGPIWAAAHTTQFTQPGWLYLASGNGVGHLAGGGTYVILVPPNNQNGDFSMILETMVLSESEARWGNPASYQVSPQNVSITLAGGLNPAGKALHLWCSYFDNQTYFQQLPDFTPVNGQFTLYMGINSLCTITTTTGQVKGEYPPPPAAAPFPIPYKDNFDEGVPESQPKYFTDETGSFAFYEGTSSVTVRQVVILRPIAWCGDSKFPVSIIGDVSLSTYTVSVDILIEGEGFAGVAGHISNIAQNPAYDGYYFIVANNGTWSVLLDQQTVQSSGTIANFDSSIFHSVSLNFSTTSVSAALDGQQVSSVLLNSARTSGWAGITSGWNYAQFDNFLLV